MADDPETIKLDLGDKVEAHERLYRTGPSASTYRPQPGPDTSTLIPFAQEPEPDETYGTFSKTKPPQPIPTNFERAQVRYLREIRNCARWLVAIVTLLLLLSIVYCGLTYYKTFYKPTTVQPTASPTASVKHHHHRHH